MQTANDIAALRANADRLMALADKAIAMGLPGVSVAEDAERAAFAALDKADRLEAEMRAAVVANVANSHERQARLWALGL